MSDKYDFDEEAILKTAEGFPPKKRALFLALLPAPQKAYVVEQLRLRAFDDAIPNHDGETVDLPTLMMTTDEGIRDDHDSVQTKPANEAVTELIDPENGISRSQAADDHFPENDKADSGTQVEEPRKLLDATLVGKSSKGHLLGEQSNVNGSDSQARVHLLRRHARGAIGEVFVAYDDQLSREVALKRIRPELSRDERHVMRFIREAVITAQLQHPGIVPIYNFGKHNESSHYTMPLVSGSTLAEEISQAYRRLSTRPTTVEWMSRIRPLLTHFVAVCHAIDYAHSRNVLHRDLKPSNIMIGSQGQTLVLDWGCAKVLDEKDGAEGAANFKIASKPQSRGENKDTAFDSDVTIAGTVLGTVEFMSPEQAEGEMENIGPASDIFGLGATLFNLLTNKTAIGNVRDVEASLKKVREGDFAKINQAGPWVPAPLAAICHHAMNADQEKRYKTSGDMARDIDAFLAGEPVAAYSESLPERSVRYVKRHSMLVAAMIGLLIVGLGALIPVTLMIEKQSGIVEVTNTRLNGLTEDLHRSKQVTERLRSAIQKREQTIRRISYAKDMLRATNASSQQGQSHIVRDLVEKWKGNADDVGWEWQQLRLSISSRAASNFAQQLQGRPAFAWHPNGDRFAIANGSDILLLGIDGRSSTIQPGNSNQLEIIAIDYSHDGDRLACLSDDGSVLTIDASSGAIDQQYSTTSDDSIEYEPRAKSVAWSSDDQYLAAIDFKGGIRAWKVVSGEEISHHIGAHRLLQVNPKIQEEIQIAEQADQSEVRDKAGFNVLAFAPKSTRLAFAGDGDRIYIFDFDKMDYIAKFKKSRGKSSLAWSPNGEQIAVSVNQSITVWDIAEQKRIQTLVGPGGQLTDISWSNSCDRIAAATDGGRICLWDTRSWNWCADYELHKNGAYAISWSANSEILGSTSPHGRIELLRSKPAKD